MPNVANKARIWAEINTSYNYTCLIDIDEVGCTFCKGILNIPYFILW
jgi:hypothetical protein